MLEVILFDQTTTVISVSAGIPVIEITYDDIQKRRGKWRSRAG